MPNTSVEFSPSHPALAFTPVCTLTKSMYFNSAGFRSKVTASPILKWFALTPASWLSSSVSRSMGLKLSAYPHSYSSFDQ